MGYLHLIAEPSELSGDASGLSGDVSALSGDVSGLTGYVSDLRGDVSGLCGNVTDFPRGDYGDELLVHIAAQLGFEAGEVEA